MKLRGLRQYAWALTFMEIFLEATVRLEYDDTRLDFEQTYAFQPKSV